MTWGSLKEAKYVCALCSFPVLRPPHTYIRMLAENGILPSSCIQENNQGKGKRLHGRIYWKPKIIWEKMGVSIVWFTREKKSSTLFKDQSGGSKAAAAEMLSYSRSSFRKTSQKLNISNRVGAAVSNGEKGSWICIQGGGGVRGHCAFENSLYIYKAN